MLTAGELDEERQLVEAARQDPRHLEAQYERYFHRVYSFALARTGDASMAEDVTSETFRRALQGLPRFEWRGVPFSAWLFRIAANNASDARRGQAAQTELPDDPAGAASDLAQIEGRVELYALVEQLPEDQQRVIVLRFVEEKRVREIAAAMGRSEGAVKQLQFRALRSLRDLAGES
jgi:RNA polymerase sigma-70 factor (ECF subfamily)